MNYRNWRRAYGSTHDFHRARISEVDQQNAVACPTCQRKAGEFCRPIPNDPEGIFPHKARVEAWREASKPAPSVAAQ